MEKQITSPLPKSYTMAYIEIRLPRVREVQEGDMFYKFLSNYSNLTRPY
jgi:hypothetical protein